MSPVGGARLEASGDGYGLDAYIDQLLALPAEPAAMEFWLVSAGGVAFALPADAVRPDDGQPAGEVPVSTAGEVVDLAAAALGRPSTTPKAERRRLVLAAHPSRVLEVDRIDGRIAADEGRIRWRASDGPRPWLAGMLDAPQAAVVALDRLF